jgi:hypothetical protein
MSVRLLAGKLVVPRKISFRPVYWVEAFYMAGMPEKPFVQAGVVKEVCRMNETVELILRILGLLIALAGLAVVYAAPRIVDKRDLASRKKIPPDMENMMTPEEKEKYKRDMAILDVKLRGLILASPGFVLILIAFS